MSDPGVILRNEIQKNFPQFGSIRVDVIYNSMDDMAYDYETGVATPTIDATVNVKAILGKVSATASFSTTQGEDTAVLAIDKSALIPALDLPFDPRVGDQLIIAGVTWRVKGFKTDPATAAWSLWIRPNQQPYISP